MSLAQMAEDATTSEAALQAEAFKARGNALLAEKQYREAVHMYTNAIELDPDNAVYYSNRSAAYLALGDERGNALRDADKCIALRPEWWKGYSRKGAAEHALLRFDAARATYQRGLELDPDNASLLSAAEDAYNAGQEHSRRLREAAKLEEQQRKEREERDAEQRRQEEQQKQQQEQASSDPPDEDALLAEFMSEVHELEESANCIKKDEPPKEKPPVDFGSSDGQLDRLMQAHHQWINLDPFRVLMLDVDATEEDVKQHYRKISSLVHPDKSRDPRARDAFEQVNKAYEVMLNEDRRKNFAKLITNTRERVEKERRAKLKKGVKQSELGDLAQEQEKAVIKAFAEMEHRRVNTEKREAAQKRREAEQQEKEQEQLKQMFKRERTWAEEDRREHRVGNWRDFQKGGPKRRKEGEVGAKREERPDEKKYGAVDNESYKRNWK